MPRGMTSTCSRDEAKAWDVKGALYRVETSQGHDAHLPALLAYWPAGQLETQRPSVSSDGKTLPSGQPPRLAHAFGSHEVHCVARGPSQLLQFEAQPRHTRLSLIHI